MYLQRKKRLRRLVLFSILKRKKFKLQDSILILSEPRGGSTWLSEIIGALPGAIINLEPLHASQGVVPPTFNFGWNPYLKISDSSPAYIQLFEDIFLFKIFNKWTTGFISIKELITSKNVVTKFVLANRLLPWITAHFGEELKYKPIYLIRHPLTTCVSQLKTFHNVEFEDLFSILPEDDLFEEPKIINNGRFKKHKKYINSLPTKIERQVALWCVNNVELINSSNDQWISVFYEDLVLDPVDEIHKLSVKLKLPVEKNFWREFDFKRPSSSDFHGNYRSNPAVQLTQVFAKISQENLQKIQKVLDYFQFKMYSAFEPFPKLSNK